MKLISVLIPTFEEEKNILDLINEIEKNLINTKYNYEHIKFQAQELLDLNQDEYLIENICFKENSKVPIIEESAKLKIAEILIKNGKKVTIKDEIQLIQEVQKEYGKLFEYQII